MKVALVRPWEASVLAGGLLPGEAGAHGTVLDRNFRRLRRSIRVLGGPGLLHLGLDDFWARQVLGYKLVLREIVVRCDASQETEGVLLKGGSEDDAERVHL